MSKPLVKEISHTQIPVLDLNRSFAFYLNILGFQLKGNFGDFAVIGSKIIWATEDQEGRKFSEFYDPDGNMIVAHEEPKNIL